MTSATIYMILVFLPISFISCCQSGLYLTSSKIIVDENTTVTLTCKNHSGLILSETLWRSSMYEPTTGLIAITPNDPCFSAGFLNDSTKYEVQCDTDRQFSVLVKNVNRSYNEVKWACKTVIGSECNWVILNVSVPVTKTELHANTLSPINENSTATFVCSTFSLPAANISWYLSNGTSVKMLSKNSRVDITRTETKRSDKLIISNESLTYRVDRNDHEWYIFCNASTLKGNTVNSTSISLSVVYPPEKPPMIQSFTNGSTISVIEGRNATLSCSVEGGNPPGRPKWTCINESNTVIYQKHYVVTEVSKVSLDLTFTAKRSEIEKCFCQTDHSLSNAIVYVVINVLYPPRILSMKNMTVLEESNFNITCDVTAGNPREATFKWTRNTDDFVSNGSILALTNVKRGFSAIYSCTANNTMEPTNDKIHYGVDSESFFLVILFPAVFKHPLMNTSVAKGDNFSKACQVLAGNPKETFYNWTKNGDLLNLHEHVLEIPHATREDASIYACTIFNRMTPTVGHTVIKPMTSEFYLNVFYAAEVTQLSTNNNASSVIVLNEMEPLTIECSVEGNPLADISIFFTTSDEHIKTVHSSQYISYSVSNSSFLNAGIYVCTAKNNYTHGEPSNTDVTVIIKGNPRPLLDEGNYTATYTKQHETLTMVFIAHPYLDINGTTTFTWYKTMSPINADGNRIQIKKEGLRSELIIKNVTSTDFGNYTLNVTNSVGSYTHVYEIFAKDITSAEETMQDGPNIAAIAGGVGSAVIVIVAGLVAVWFIRKRRGKGKEPAKSVYQNVPFGVVVNNKKADRKSERKKLDETPMEILQDVDDVPANQTEHTEYFNSSDAVENLKRIKINELLAFVSGRSEEAFEEEYQKLPTELIKPCTFARRPENIALNRYKGIFPYDHSRVKIDGQPDFFMNACYIDGYKKPNAYIASLGPTFKTSDNFISFWKMLWFHQSDRIVMLTNLNEPSGPKCDQYWPDNQITKSYGDYLVSGENQEVFAEYTVRHLVVSFNGLKRRVTHLHYTAWPDKKVPEDAATLLEFRQRLKTSHSLDKGPIIVHCSAGIGRTGTLIALDRLVTEGKNEGSVDVFTCVNSMREQRVKMVQTQDQYIYIYKALVSRLYFECETIPLAQFHSYVQNLNNNKISEQFQNLKQSVETDIKEEKKARAENERLISLNREGVDVPGNLYRVKLFLHKGEQDSDYINAVYLNSFMKVDHFITAQSPLSNSVYDFISMVHQETCSCIVSMEDMQEPGLDVGAYLPQGGDNFKMRKFTVSCKTLETNPEYIVREMRIQNNSRIGKKEHVAYHFHFTGWTPGNDTPRDVKQFVQFVKAVMEYDEQLCEEDSHVLVHCLKASERSALFCLLSILLKKIQYEGHVNVLNTVRHVRKRRREALTSMEQLRFCYKALDHFVGTSMS